MRLADALQAADPRALLVAPGIRLTAADLLALVPPFPDPAGQKIALSIDDPVRLVRALFALDGRVDTLLLLAPALPADTISRLVADTGASLILSDRTDLPGSIHPDLIARGDLPRDRDSSWVMTTSGTTGLPKTVRHSLSTLVRTVRPAHGEPPRWGLLYEPSRFAGLQVVLQALMGGGTLVAPDSHAPLGEQLRFMATQGVSHLSATPSMWRKLLMMPESDELPLRQLTLGGEIADGQILSALAQRFAQARVTHIYASTETGVGFSVKDGRPGLPAEWLENGVDGVVLKLADDILWLKPPGADKAEGAHLERDQQGFIRTGDRMKIEGDRLLFLGRDSSTVNIGGTKINPEDVEQTMLRHPDIVAALVTARPNPILGAVLNLAVVPAPHADDRDALLKSIKAWAKAELPREARPSLIRIVDELETTAAGKIARTGGTGQ